MPTSVSGRKFSNSSFEKNLRANFFDINNDDSGTDMVCLFCTLITGTFPLSHFIQFWTYVITFFSYL